MSLLPENTDQFAFFKLTVQIVFRIIYLYNLMPGGATSRPRIFHFIQFNMQGEAMIQQRLMVAYL